MVGGLQQQQQQPYIPGSVGAVHAMGMAVPAGQQQQMQMPMQQQVLLTGWGPGGPPHAAAQQLGGMVWPHNMPPY
jgi:hypothetical protein